MPGETQADSSGVVCLDREGRNLVSSRSTRGALPRSAGILG